MAGRNAGGGWLFDGASLGAPSATIPVGGMYRSTVDVSPELVLGYGVWVKRELGTIVTVASPEEIAYTWERLS